MRKFKLFTILTLTIFMLFSAGQAFAAYSDMSAEVYTWDGGMNADGTMKLTRVTSGITFQVLQADSDTIETLTYFGGSTSLTNPVTTTNFASNTVCNDRVRFRVDPGETNDRYVDLIVTDTAGGYTAFVENFDKWQHTIVIDERPGIIHHGLIWFTAAAGSATEIDTGIDFDYDTKIVDVQIEVVTVDSAESIEVGLLSSGTNGDADGFRDIVLLTTAGIVSDTGIITGGSTIDYTAATTYGALLVTAITGSDAVATVGGKSWIGHHVISANEQSLTYTTTVGTDTGVGYIHYDFIRTR